MKQSVLFAVLFIAATANLRGNNSESVNAMQEIITAPLTENIGYGAITKGDRTTAISSTGSELFEGRLLLSLEDALQGELAGVRIVTRDGQPGNSCDIIIRGTGTFLGSTTPLYVIDGVPTHRLDINPHDIASISILKDGASTAIYGPDGANGVVLITTRRGKEGAPQVSFDFNNSVQTPVRKIKMMDSYQYQKMHYDASSLFYPADSHLSFDNNYNHYRDSEGNYYFYPKSNTWSNYAIYADPSNPDYVNTDWTRDILRSAFLRDYSLRIAGGSRKLSYAVMGGHFNQDGIIRGSDYRRWSARANLEYAFSRNVILGANLSGLFTRQRGSDYSTENGVLMTMLKLPPTLPCSYDYGPYMITQKDRREQSNRNLYARIYLITRFTGSLKSTLAMNCISEDENGTSCLGPWDSYGYSYRTTEERNRTKEWSADYVLDYTPRLRGPFALKVTGGIVLDHTSNRYRYTEEDFFVSANNNYKMSDPIPYRKIDYKELSFFARANASLWNDLLLSASVRYIYNKQSIGNDACYPAISAGWRFAPGFKVRYSLGKNSSPSSLTYSSVTINSNALQSPNPKIPYSVEHDMGVDGAFLRGRLNMSFDFYSRRSSNVMMLFPLLSKIGYTTVADFSSRIRNTGVEFSLDGKVISQGIFKWNTRFNISHNQSKVLSLPGGDTYILSSPNNISGFDPCAIMQNGTPLGAWYGYKTDGIFRNYSEISSLSDNYSVMGYPKWYMRPSMQRYGNISDEWSINTVDKEDRTILGYAEPKFTGGLRNTFSYRNFSLNLGLEFSYGGKVFNATRAYLSQPESSNNSVASMANYWRPALYDITTGNRVDAGNENASIPLFSSNYYNLDTFIEDASFLRISDITLSWSLGSRVHKAIRARDFSLWVSVKNAWVVTGYTGYDPDVSTGGIMTPGLDWSAYPRARSYTLGMKMAF